MRKVFRLIYRAIGLVMLVGIAICVAYVFRVVKALEPKVDPARYESIVHQLAERGMAVEFLPQSIPAEAERVAFYHLPGFLQGGDIVVLRLALPSSQVTSLIEALTESERAEVTDRAAVPIRPTVYPAYDMEKPRFNNLFEVMSPLPDDFRMFLYGTDEADFETPWNIRALAFTAVSTSRHEVVYYFERW